MCSSAILGIQKVGFDFTFVHERMQFKREILDIFRKTNGVMLSTLVELDISENFFKERATLLKFAKSMMRFSRAKVDIRSFSVSNILKILYRICLATTY